MEYVFGVMWLDDIKYLNIRIRLVSKKNWEVNLKYLDNEFNCIICSNLLVCVNYCMKKNSVNIV